jgi:hypothetical protein
MSGIGDMNNARVNCLLASGEWVTVDQSSFEGD